MTFKLIAFDADDTLWENESLYARAQAKFRDLLAFYHPPEWIGARLYETEMRNLAHFGYGVKAFTLSMIETAIELTDGQISGQDIKFLIDQGKQMLTAEIVLLEHAGETVRRLAQEYTLMLITKGDLLDQESKIRRSGIQDCFKYIEVVSNKDIESYSRLLREHDVRAQDFLMIGNSLRSDILPILDLGGSAVYIPYITTWLHESAALPPMGTRGFYQLEHLGQLPELIEIINKPS
jgi:putative hydrolase of the HAD superfamily